MTYFWHHEEISDVMKNFLTPRRFFDITMFFWRHDIFLTSWRTFSNVMTNYVTSWRTFFTLWRTFLTSWYMYDVTRKLFDAMTYFWLHDVTLTPWRIFGVITYFLCCCVCIVHCFTSWRNSLTSWFIFDGTTNCLTSWLLFWRQDALFDVIQSFDVMSYFWPVEKTFLTSWYIFKVMTNLFYVMTYFLLLYLVLVYVFVYVILMSWRIFDVMTNFWRHDIFLT